jgi:beta-glucosidase
MARQSMVLLKNDNQLLPLDKKKYPAIMVVGSNSTSMDALLGNYHGVSKQAVNFLEGITNAVDAGTRVEYDQGSDYTDTTHFGGIWAAGNADITVAVIGLTPVYEGEEGDAFLAAKGGDKPDMSLPAAHIAFMKALRKANRKPIIAVITAGSAVDISAIEPYADAIILAWYPGEQGGNALADILFGKVSPAGRLPVTFYQSFADVPAYDNYAMKGRTYRYFSGKVQYPFGYGLSYTSFAYEWAQMPGNIRTAKDSISFSIKVKNTGSMDGDEVVQVYVEYPPVERMPLKELKAFKRVQVKAGGSATVQLTIPAADLQKWDLTTNSWKLYPGAYTLFAGGNSTDKKIVATIKAGSKK